MVDAVQPIMPFTMDANGRIVPVPIPAAPPPPASNALMAGFRSGGDLFVKSLGGAAAAAGQALGSQGLQDFGVDVAQRYGQYAQQAARPDLEGSYGPTGLLYKGAQMLPSLGAMLGGAVAGGAVGGPAGAFAGGALFSAPQTAGEFMNTAMEQPGGAAPGEGKRALALGLPTGAALALAPPGLGSMAGKGVLKGAMRDGLIMGGTMGTQSGVSTALDQTFRDDPGSFSDRAKEIVSSALQGFAMGGITGGVIGGVTGRTPTAELKAKVNADLGLVGEVEPSGAEQAGGMAAPGQPALAAPPERLALPAPDGSVRTVADHTDEQLQAFHDDLSSKTNRTPQEDQLLGRIEAEVNTRNSTPDALNQRYQDALASGDPEQIKAATDAFDRADPNQQPLDLGGTPVGEQPVSRAVRQQQEAVAAQQQAFVDQAKSSGATRFAKILEKQPVSTPEEFAAAVYDNFDNKIPSMKKLADSLGLVDDKGKLFTPDTLAAAHKDAVYQNLLNPTTESTARVTKLEDTAKLLDTIKQKRAESTDVPEYQSRGVGGDLDVAPKIPVTEPGLPLDIPHPLPLQGFKTPLDMIRGLTKNERAQSGTKMGTPEGEIARMMNTKDLAGLSADTLRPLGLLDKDGKRLSYDDAMANWKEKADDAQGKGDMVARGQAQAHVDQIQKIKAVDDFHKAQDATGADLKKPSIKKAFQDLEAVRRQLPPEMPNAAERVQEMHNNLVAEDTGKQKGYAGQASQLTNLIKERLAQAKDGHPADLTPLKASLPPGQPSQAAVERGNAIKARQKPKAAQQASQTFTTAKGSTYTAHSDGTTTRIKAARSDPGHEGDSGLKPRTDKTVYLSPADAQRLAPPQGTWRIIDHGDGTVSLATHRQDGKWGISPSARNVPVSDKPTAGSAPLEMWKKSKVNGHDAYGTVHFGNEITQLGAEAARPTVSLMITQQQRAQLRQRGYTDAQIREMKPQAAHDILSKAAPSKAAPPKTQAEAKARRGTARVPPDELTDAARADLEKLGLDVNPPELARVARPELRTRMDDDIEHLMSAGATSKELLAHIAENSSDPFRRQLAQELLKKGVDPTIGFGDRGEVKFDEMLHPDAEVSASYNRANDHIGIYDRSDMETNVLHEMMHAATADAIDKGGQHSRKLEQLFDTISKRVSDDTRKGLYGLTNVHEFVAEAFTNPRFQDFLRNQNVETGSRLGNLWQAFKNLVFKALGMPERMRSAFDQAIESGNRLMEEAAVSRDGVGSVPDAERQTNAMMNEMPRMKDSLDRLGEQAREAAASGKSFNTKAVEFIKHAWNDASTSGAIVRRMADKMLRHAATILLDAKHDRSTQFKQFAGLSDTARKGWAALDGKARVLISELQQLDALHINPARNWAQQTWLHDKPGLKAEVDSANDTYRKLKQVGGDAGMKVYDDMKLTNSAFWRGKQVDTLEKIAAPFIKDLGLKQFEGKMADRFQQRDDLHTDLNAAHSFIDQDYTAKMAELKRALGGKAQEISGLASQGKMQQADRLLSKYAGLMDWVKRIDEAVIRSDEVPNFHKGRYGDWGVSGHFNVVDGKLDARAMRTLKARLDAATGGDTVFHVSGENPTILMRFENKDVAHNVHEIMKQAQRDGLLDKDKDVKYLDTSKEQSMRGTIPQHVLDLWQQIEASDLYRDHDPAARDALEQRKRAFMSAWLDLVPDNAVSNVLQMRTFTNGSSNDVLRNFVHRNQILAHSIAAGAAEPKINAAIGAMRARIDDMQGSSKPHEIDDASRDFNSLVRYENEAPKRVTDGFIDTMRSFNHAYFLGFSPSYVLMQMIQPVQTALPELGKQFGYAQSMKEMAKTLPHVTQIMQAIIRAPTRVDGTITRQMLLDAGVNKKIVDVVMRGVNDGTIELGGATRELGKVAAGTEEQWHGKVTRMANTLPMWSETASRLVAHIAADALFEANPEKARIPGMKFDAKTATPAELAKARAAFSRFFVQETMGRYGSGETPHLLTEKGPLGRATPLVGAFMTYYFQMFEKVVHEIHGAFDRTASKEERGMAQKYLAGHMGAMAVLTGTMGLPFFNAITGLATKALNLGTNRDDWDVAGSYRNLLSDVFSPAVGSVIARGIPRAMGFDLSHLGEQDMLPFTQIMADRRKMDERIKDWSTSMLGSPGSMMLSVYDGLNEMAQGRPLEGMIQAAPVGLRNGLKAYKLGTQGYVNQAGLSENIDSGPADVLAQALGIKMAQPADYAEASHEMAQLNAARQQRSASLSKNLFAAFERGGPDDQNEAMAAARKFDLQHPSNMIMKGFAGNLTQRRLTEATAAATGGPLGLPALNLGMRNQLRYFTDQ